MAATGKHLVSGVVESVLFDTGAGRSCMATDTAARMLQQGQARAVGSVRAQLNTRGGAVADDFKLIRANLALPSCSLVSVEEDFLVVPTLTADSSSWEWPSFSSTASWTYWTSLLRLQDRGSASTASLWMGGLSDALH
jgi:hypothetical protein